MTAQIRRAPGTRLDKPGLSRVLGNALNPGAPMGPLVACCACGILISLLTYGPALLLVANGTNDFRSLYPAGVLAFTPGLYNFAKAREVMQQAVHSTTGVWPYDRLPYHALMFWPLARFPYLTAYWIWQAFSFSALIGFAWLWPIPNRRITVLACCWSIPMFTILAEAQDTSFLMLWIALAVFLMRRNRPFWGGLIFALCAAKYHLFVLIPLWIIANRLWKFAAGFLTGGVALLLVSFATAGWSWPVDYVRLILSPFDGPTTSIMPTLRAVFVGSQHAFLWEILASATVTATVWLVMRRSGPEQGLAAALAGGLLVGHHAYVADCTVLIPALLIVMSSTGLPWLRWNALFLLTPAATLLMFLGSPVAIVRAAILLLVFGMAWEIRSLPSLSASRTSVPVSS